MYREKKTMTGNDSVAHVSYAFTDVAAIYPITPSSSMAENVDRFAVQLRKNIFGREVKVVEMQSEAGVAGAMHGVLTSGALATTYTASQGLLLMIPDMYKMAGELLPCVIHVAARTVATHALSILGDHSDIYACRQTGFAMLCSNSPQECMDLSAVAHLVAVKGRVPFIHFFDGFRTSHEVQKVEVWDYDTLKELFDFEALKRFKDKSLNPSNPVLRGSTQNDDIFFQNREACNKYYSELPFIVSDYMEKINSMIGSSYKLFNYCGAKDAERVIIAMGSVCETIEETVNYLNKKGEKVGLVKVRLFRPFSAKHFLDAIPETVEAITVLDRTKEPGSSGEPLFLDILSVLKNKKVKVYSGRYGLSSKNTNPSDINAVFENMKKDLPKEKFTVGIVDDVTNLSLNVKKIEDTTPEGTYACKFWGFGSDGTVSASQNAIKIIGDNTDLFVQGYFAHDSRKSGGLTVAHMRFSQKPIKSTYYIDKADFVVCNNQSYIYRYDMVSELKKGGVFLLNTSFKEAELGDKLPNFIKKFLAENEVSFYIIDAVAISEKLGLTGKINTVMQAAFFKISNLIDIDKATLLMKRAAEESYGKKGSEVVEKNYSAIDLGLSNFEKVSMPKEWKSIVLEKKDKIENNENFVCNILKPISCYKGNDIPVSAFLDHEDGTIPQGTSKHEKLGIAISVPVWNPENCIQCNLCSFVCPHAAIRPAVLNEEELKNAPLNMKTCKMNGFDDKSFAITISPFDCNGCLSCKNICPGKQGKKALSAAVLSSQKEEQKFFDYAEKLSSKEDVKQKFKFNTVKGSQFNEPLLQFSGACAGCGETPYARLATQLFGEHMIIANATGCSSIWGGSMPFTPYSVSKNGRGPAWHNSLFEDNAEFGFGIYLAKETIRKNLLEKVKKIKSSTKDQELILLCENYIDTFEDTLKNFDVSNALLNKLESIQEAFAKEILQDKEYLAKKSVWIFGGDGWAYDIGFGGLDHVIASGANVNILVFDTEVYSNTGGQSSKATPKGAVAKFAFSGKKTSKKDLALIAMTYRTAYVAQVAMGADYAQCLKAFCEAESYNGPSIIIAYSPCIAHGIKGGMSGVQAEEKRAVLSGYWNLFRFDPRIKKSLTIDSKKPSLDYKDFIMNESRFSSLDKNFSCESEALFDAASSEALEKYNRLLKIQNFFED